MNRTYTITLSESDLLLTRYALAYQYSAAKEAAKHCPTHSVRHLNHVDTASEFYRIQKKFMDIYEQK